MKLYKDLGANTEIKRFFLDRFSLKKIGLDEVVTSWDLNKYESSLKTTHMVLFPSLNSPIRVNIITKTPPQKKIIQFRSRPALSWASQPLFQTPLPSPNPSWTRSSIIFDRFRLNFLKTSILECLGHFPAHFTS